MCEKEERAIEDLKSLLRYKGENIPVLDIDFNAIETVLNLIDKQEKEIKELKEENRRFRRLLLGEEK